MEFHVPTSVFFENQQPSRFFKYDYKKQSEILQRNAFFLLERKNGRILSFGNNTIKKSTTSTYYFSAIER